MKSVSLIQEAQRRGEQLSFWISLILSAVFALMSCIFLAYSQITAVQDDFLTNEKNFSYWIETGDVFQLDRALSNFVKVHSQVKEIELEKEGFEIASLRSKNYSQKILSKKIVFERELAGARAKIFYDISFKEILYIPILFFLIYLILRFSIKNLMTRFGRSILNPLTDFSLSIGGASSLEEIQGLTHSKGKILELDALIEKLSLLGFRVSEAERKASKVKELEFVNRISKQVAVQIDI